MPVSEELVTKVCSGSDTAIVVIGRTAGEDKDNKAEEGSYLLTTEEEDMLRKVCGAFDRTVVLYPFGFGLSYTTFALDGIRVEEEVESVRVTVNVTNQGDAEGKEVVQVYCSAPQGALGQPARSLCGFSKTVVLAPGEREKVSIQIARHT